MESTPLQSIDQPKKKFWRFALLLAAIIVLGFAAIFWRLVPYTWEAWQQQRETRQLVKQMEEQKRREAEDTYGGQTPQETYQLFIDALKKEDIDLAVKYFSFDKQDEIRQRLTRIRDNGKWQLMVDVFSGKLSRIEFKDAGTGTLYEVMLWDKADLLIAAFQLEKYSHKNLWKLTRFD